MKYAKFVAEVVATVLAAVVAALVGDNALSPAEALNVVVLGLGAIAVLGAGELPAGVWRHTKTIVAAATAGALFLTSAISGGITTAEWLQFALACAGALGVGAAPGPVVVPAGALAR